MHSSKQQVSLERFGFGKRDEVKNPVPLPLPVLVLDVVLSLCISVMHAQLPLPRVCRKHDV